MHPIVMLRFVCVKYFPECPKKVVVFPAQGIRRALGRSMKITAIRQCLRRLAAEGTVERVRRSDAEQYKVVATAAATTAHEGLQQATDDAGDSSGAAKTSGTAATLVRRSSSTPSWQAMRLFHSAVHALATGDDRVMTEAALQRRMGLSKKDRAIVRRLLGKLQDKGILGPATGRLLFVGRCVVVVS